MYRYAWHDGVLDVGHDVLPSLGVTWGAVGQHVTQVARLHLRQHPSLFNRLQVVGDVVHQLLASLSKRRRVHGNGRCATSAAAAASDSALTYQSPVIVCIHTRTTTEA